MSSVHVMELQRIVGATRDGIFGENTLRLTKQAIDKGAPASTQEYTQKPWNLAASEVALLNREATTRLVRFVLELESQSRFAFGFSDILRTLEEQESYVKSGVSWTMNSKHLPGPDGKSRAVDIVWRDERDRLNFGNAECYTYLAHLGMKVGKELGINIRNLGLSIGRDWYHFELVD